MKFDKNFKSSISSTKQKSYTNSKPHNLIGYLNIFKSLILIANASLLPLKHSLNLSSDKCEKWGNPPPKTSDGVKS